LSSSSVLSSDNVFAGEAIYSSHKRIVLETLAKSLQTSSKTSTNQGSFDSFINSFLFIKVNLKTQIIYTAYTFNLSNMQDSPDPKNCKPIIQQIEDSKIFTKSEMKVILERSKGSRKDPNGTFAGRIKPKIIELLVWFKMKESLENLIKPRNKPGLISNMD